MAQIMLDYLNNLKQHMYAHANESYTLEQS